MTTLGLLSDSHGRAHTTHDAAQLLVDHGADILVHLGDIGTTQVIDAMAMPDPRTGLQIQAHMVLGNTDWDTRTLTRYAADLGVRVHDPVGHLTIDDREIAFTHGHLPSVMQALAAQEPDYILQGHTHIPCDSKYGEIRLLNPGALFRAPRYTVALLTPSTGAFEVLELASVAREG